MSATASGRYRPPFLQLLVQLPLLLAPLTLSLFLAGRLAAVDQPGSGAGDRVEDDRWYVGSIGGSPAASLHGVSVVHADGSRTMTTTMKLVMVRAIPNAHGAAMSATVLMDESQSSDEDAQGNLVAMHVDQGQAGFHTIAEARVEPQAAGGRHLVGEQRSSGRRTAIDLPLEAGMLLGDHAANMLLAQAPLKIGGTLVYTTIALMDSLVQVHTSSTLEGEDPAGRHYKQTCKEMPMQIEVGVARSGAMLSMHMDMGILKLDLEPADGPPKLLGAVIPASGLISNAGAEPVAGPRNSYRLPNGAQVVENEFQHVHGGVLTVESQAAAGPLTDPASYLGSELHLQTDDAQLAAWAKQQVEGISDPQVRAEAMRVAVRSYLTGDLAEPNGDALQTFRCRHGACTEHSALQCAALRPIRIPARIEMGLLWSADNGGWVGHAWVAAYAGGAWRLLDSAFPGQPRSCYIELAPGSGVADDRVTGLLRSIESFHQQPVTTLAP